MTDNITNLKNIYQTQGWVIVKNFFTKQSVNKIKKQILTKAKKSRSNDHLYFEKIGNKKKLRRIEKVSDFSKISKNMIYSKKIFSLIKKIKNKEFGLFKDKLNFKYPGGKGYLPHIDGHFLWKDKYNKQQNGWKKYSDDFINLVIPIEKTNRTNGCIYLANINDTKKLGNSFNKISKKMVLGTPNIKNKDKKKFSFTPIELNEGDICFFDWKCAHFSKNNDSTKSRMIFYATYYNKKNKKNVRNSYYLDKLTSLNDKKNKSLLFS
jgi:ectoine hydroxylase-related dioxygenase (phytanoyl-CoA dioxygenase family)